MRIFCKIGLHSWNGCKCKRCGKRRDLEHDWKGSRCAICHRTRDKHEYWGDEHFWKIEERSPAYETAKRWAEKLKDKKEYRTLAGYKCVYLKHPRYGTRQGKRSEELAKAKKKYADKVLSEAGDEALDAMLVELEIGENKSDYIVKNLVAIGDPKVVPLFEKTI